MKSKFVSIGFIFVVLAGLLAGCGNDNAPANSTSTDSGAKAGTNNGNGGLGVGSGNSAGTTTSNGPIVVTGKLGQTLTKGDYALTVSQVYRYADNDEALPLSMKINQPKLTMLAVEMKIANNSANNLSGELSSAKANYGVSAEGQLRLKKADGSYLEGNGGGFKKPEMPRNDNLQPDAPAQGWVTFDLPKDLNPNDLFVEYKVPASYYDVAKLDLTFVVALKH